MKRKGVSSMGLHDGHRKRLMEKLDSGTLLTHEDLEMLLFYAIPRRNTNGLAHKLLKEFGSLRAIFSASVEALCKVEGVGLQTAAFLSLIGKLCERVYTMPYSDYEGPFESARFIPYIYGKLSKEKEELAEVYSLNKKGEVVRCRRIDGGGVFNVNVLPEEISHVFLDEDTVGVVLVHNHPLGRAQPSGTDDLTTRKCQMLCSCHNVLLCDHVIVAPSGVYSYYASGRMQEFSENYSVEALIKSGK